MTLLYSYSLEAAEDHRWHPCSQKGLWLWLYVTHVWDVYQYVYLVLPIDSWEWLMIFTWFAQLTYVSVLHWMVRLYYYGFLVNECIGLILVIQTFYPSALVYCMIHYFSFLLYLNHIMLYKALYAFLLYWYYDLYIFTDIPRCSYITITILLWMLSIYTFIKDYTIIILC